MSRNVNRKNYEYLFFCVSFFFCLPRSPAIKYKRHVANALMASVDISHRFFYSLSSNRLSSSIVYHYPTNNNKNKSPFHSLTLLRVWHTQIFIWKFSLPWWHKVCVQSKKVKSATWDDKLRQNCLLNEFVCRHIEVLYFDMWWEPQNMEYKDKTIQMQSSFSYTQIRI